MRIQGIPGHLSLRGLELRLMYIHVQRKMFSPDEVCDKIKQLEQCVSMNEIQDLYKSCEYSAVVDKLLPLFDEDPDPPIEV